MRKLIAVQEKACAAVDEEKPSSPSEYETDEEWEEERKKKQADQLKEQVNSITPLEYNLYYFYPCFSNCVCFSLSNVVDLRT